MYRVQADQECPEYEADDPEVPCRPELQYELRGDEITSD